jgi:hypothetical protein
MLPRVGVNRPVALKSVSDFIFPFLRFVDFGDAILKQIREPSLQQLQGVVGGLDGACSSFSLWDLKGFVSGSRSLLEENVGEGRELEAQ